MVGFKVKRKEYNFIKNVDSTPTEGRDFDILLEGNLMAHKLAEIKVS